MTDAIEAMAQEVLYEWLENNMWGYADFMAIHDEETPCVQQIYAQIMGWA